MSDDNRKPLVIRHVDVGALAAAKPFMRPLGATPLIQLMPDEHPTLALVRESDENATDGELDVWMSYKVRWHAFLGGGAS